MNSATRTEFFTFLFGFSWCSFSMLWPQFVPQLLLQLQPLSRHLFHLIPFKFLCYSWYQLLSTFQVHLSLSLITWIYFHFQLIFPPKLSSFSLSCLQAVEMSRDIYLLLLKLLVSTSIAWLENQNRVFPQ